MQETIPKIGLFYGSSSGHTKAIAKRIKRAVGVYAADLVSVSNIFVGALTDKRADSIEPAGES